MTRYLLDTNIISDAMKPVPSEPLSEWMTNQGDENLFISSLSLAEIRRGILQSPAGKKRRELEAWFVGREGPQELFRGHVLAFEERAALVWARLMAEGTAEGRPRSALDMMVAAIAEVHGCVVVTDNEKHFAGVDFLNPMRSVRGRR